MISRPSSDSRSSQFSLADLAPWLPVMVLLVSLAGSLQAQVPCPVSDPPFGTCFVQNTSYPGDYPWATTVIDGESSLVVADAFSGFFYKYQINSLSAIPAQYLSPIGPAAYLGVSWNSDEDLLYWLVEDQGQNWLVSSSSAGILISQTPIELPAGITEVTGLAWHAGTGNYWTNAYDDDLYLEFLSDGTFSGNSFQNPEVITATAEVFGLGLTITLDPLTGEYLFDLPVGAPSDQRSSQVKRVDDTGEEQGLFYPLASINALSGWVTGIAWTETGSWGGPSEFVIDLTNNSIVEVPVPNPNAPSVTVFTCAADGDNNVTLEWVNPITYSSILLLRDGVAIADLPGTDSTYTDTDLDSGTYSYSLQPVPASGATLPAAVCDVVVGFGRLLGQVAFGGSQSGPTTVIESTNQLVVADASGLTAWLYSKDLTPVSSIAGPFTSTVNLSGLAWNASDDTLAWMTEAGELIHTDLQGSIISSTTLQSPTPLGLIGEITWSTHDQQFLGIDRSVASFFAFDADGTTDGMWMSVPPTPTGAAVFLAGITSRDTANNSVCDFAVGSLNDAGISRIERAVDGVTSGIGFDIAPSVNTGEVVGISSTETGPFGTPVSYLIGGDNGVIYMFSGDLSGTGSEFVRGELNMDGTRNLVDVTVLLLDLFGQGQTPSTCIDASDINDDGLVNIADAISLLEYLFEGGSVPPAPSSSCGPDDSIDNLTCQEFDGC
ncbi:MAG: hypothetical protein HN891_00690 [Planctomycetes bacterium]|jgi:hypothetical protein|nr:hypothetical protein [Planctomycetota bacterium]